MSETTTQIEEHTEHTSPAQYVLIGAILCFLTGLEISLYYMESSLNRGILMVGLYGIAAIKFVLVCAYFMHLKDDPKVFKRWFMVGGFAALLLFTIVLVTLQFQDHRFF